MNTTVPTIDVEHIGKPRRFVFVLLKNFTMLSFASAIEALRIANRTSGKELYVWTKIGEGGESIACSNGCEFQLDGDLIETERDDTIMLCGGIDIQDATTKKLLNWVTKMIAITNSATIKAFSKKAWLTSCCSF